MLHSYHRLEALLEDQTERVTAKEWYRESGKQKGEDAQYLIPVIDLNSYWKTKLIVAAKEWYRESGKQK
jgi:hypothetical protein